MVFNFFKIWMSKWGRIEGWIWWFGDLVSHDKSRFGDKVQDFEIQFNCASLAIINCILIDYPCPLVHHIQFSFNGLKPKVVKTHFITKVGRIPKQTSIIIIYNIWFYNLGLLHYHHCVKLIFHENPNVNQKVMLVDLFNLTKIINVTKLHHLGLTTCDYIATFWWCDNIKIENIKNGFLNMVHTHWASTLMSSRF